MVNGTLRIMFYSGLRFLLSLFNTPISEQITLTSVFLLREDKKRRKGKRLKRTKNRWMKMNWNEKHNTAKWTDSKRKVPWFNKWESQPSMTVLQVCGSQIMCWQAHYGIILLQSSTVETSWLNHSPKRPERQSNDNWDPVNWKWHWWFWLSPALPSVVKQRIWENNENWAWSWTLDLKK